MFVDFIERLKTALQNPLPGEKAQFIMAPQGRINLPHSDKSVSAAVLILLYPVNEEPWIVFIKRPEYNGFHSGQISFPGGKVEKTDIGLENTALRETFEELGVPVKNVQLIGKLSPLHIPISSFDVQPFVGFTMKKPDWKPDNAEVTYPVESPLKEFLNPDKVLKEIWTLRNVQTEVPFYSIKGEKIWGATAMMMSEFLNLDIVGFL
jgi:8-oxo-dGTP pyrophosphatase MutT (NUDIX family)